VVLFVGSNPSNASTCDVAFHGSTKSSKVLTEWIKHIPAGNMVMYINVLNKKTENNRPLKKSEVTSNLEQLKSQLSGIRPTRIVALGKTASTALTLLGQSHLQMPHPSGLNRQLNDQEFVEQKMKELAEYCSTSPVKIT
jgi:uracil-DNA glycosylase family 4